VSTPDSVNLIKKCRRLSRALKTEREWVASLTRDNGLLLQAADATKAGKLAVSQAGRIEHLERENAALREALDSAIVLLRRWNKNDVNDDVVIETRKAIYAARKEAQP
jgi:hypothetical protein